MRLKSVYLKIVEKGLFFLCFFLVSNANFAQEQSDLLFSIPDWKGGWCYQMTVRGSFNGTLSWPVKRLVDTGYSAYSSLAVGKDGTIFLLYEGGKNKLYDEINLAVFNLKWLMEGKTY